MALTVRRASTSFVASEGATPSPSGRSQVVDELFCLKAIFRDGGGAGVVIQDRSGLTAIRSRERMEAKTTGLLFYWRPSLLGYVSYYEHIPH